MQEQQNKCGVCGYTTKALDADFCMECGAPFIHNKSKSNNTNGKSNGITKPQNLDNEGLQTKVDQAVQKAIERGVRKAVDYHLVEKNEKPPKQQTSEYQELEMHSDRIHEAYHDVLSIKFDNNMFSYPITRSYCGKKIKTKVRGNTRRKKYNE